MALTYTPQTDLGFKLPAFRLKSVEGKTFTDQDFSGAKALLVMFICNHCPYVRAIEDRMLNLAREMSPLGASFVAICSNDPIEYPEDAPDELLRRSQEKKYPFPYLIDETQEIAKSFKAVCTPDFFLFDQEKKLYYRGRLDDSWKDPSKVREQELKKAIENALVGKPPLSPQHPSMGCSIKWLA